MNIRTPFVRQAFSEFRKHGGMLKTMEAIRSGIHPRVLYAMRDAGLIEPLARGLYRLTDLPPLGNPDLVTAAAKAPDGVICLISALAFHNLTTQIPRSVHLALPTGKRPPQLGYPPVQVHHFSPETFKAGVETHTLDDVPVNVYSPEKTLADCFKFRNRIGMDTVLEAVKLYYERKPVRVGEILHFAETCRVSRVMTPYLEALL